MDTTVTQHACISLRLEQSRALYLLLLGGGLLCRLRRALAFALALSLRNPGKRLSAQPS